jgi:ABC-type multidrug transport system permease subunit
MSWGSFELARGASAHGWLWFAIGSALTAMAVFAVAVAHL